MRRTVIRGGGEKKFLLPFCEREREREGEEIFLGKGGECADKLSFFPSLSPASWLGVDFGVCLLFPPPTPHAQKENLISGGFFLRGGRKRRNV